jgi:hypothetical protein
MGYRLLRLIWPGGTLLNGDQVTLAPVGLAASANSSDCWKTPITVYTGHQLDLIRLENVAIECASADRPERFVRYGPGVFGTIR